MEWWLRWISNLDDDCQEVVYDEVEWEFFWWININHVFKLKMYVYLTRRVKWVAVLYCTNFCFFSSHHPYPPHHDSRNQADEMSLRNYKSLSLVDSLNFNQSCLFMIHLSCALALMDGIVDILTCLSWWCQPFLNPVFDPFTRPQLTSTLDEIWLLLD